MNYKPGVSLGLFTPGHFMRFLRSDSYLIYQNDSITPGHINVFLQNGYNLIFNSHAI